MSPESSEATSRSASSPDAKAMAYRPAVIPIATYLGAAIKNAGAILTDLAPWVFLALAMVLLGIAQVVQRRQQKAWPWSIALLVGCAIAVLAWLGALGAAQVFSPSEISSAP